MAKLRPVAWHAATGIPVLPPADSIPPDLPFNATPAVQLGENRVLTAGPRGVARVWDADASREVVQLRGHAWPVTAVAASTGGKRLATGDAGGLVRVWDGATFRPLVEPGGHRAAVHYAELSVDGKRLVTLSYDAIRVWEMATGRELRAFADAPINLAGADDIFFQRPTFSPDGLAVVFSTKDRLLTRDILTGLEVPFPGEMAKTKPGLAVFSPDGQAILTLDLDYKLAVWDWPSGRRRFEVAGNRMLQFSTDGSIIFTTSGNQERWNAKTGEELGRAWESKRTGSVEAAHALRPNPQLLVDTRDDTPRVIQAGTGLPVPEYQLVNIRAEWRMYPPPFVSPAEWPIAFSPVGRQFARVHDPASPQISIHEAATGEVRRTFVGHRDACRLLGFTPDGTRLLTAGSDHTILVWDVRLQSLPLIETIKKETSAPKLWATMCTGKADAAYLAMARLAAEPPAAVKMARMRLKPASKDIEETAATRLADTRAIELLESLSTHEACQFLQELAEGEPSAWRTQEARRARDRARK
jgi:WD40 repeat protein